MRQQAAQRHAGGRAISKRALGQAAVVRLVMLQAEVRHVIAEREQEVIVAIMPRAEELARLGNQVGHLLLIVRRSYSARLRCRRPCRVHDGSARPAA